MSQTRRLAAILAADVAGYSRADGADEAGTARALREHRAAGRAERRSVISRCTVPFENQAALKEISSSAQRVSPKTAPGRRGLGTVKDAGLKSDELLWIARDLHEGLLWI